MYLGKCKGLICNISKESPNGTVLITGISGSGKSCRQNQIELQEANSGNTVIVLDISRNHQNKDILGEIKEEYHTRTNRIDVLSEGICMNPFEAMTDKAGKKEPYAHLVNANVQALSCAKNMGNRQIGVLREAIEEVLAKQADHSEYDAMDALREVFLSHREPEWKSVYQNLWTIIQSNIFRPKGKRLVLGKINILDLSDADPLSRIVLAELILTCLWRLAYSGWALEGNTVTLSIDEFQHCYAKRHSVLKEILREGRKFGVQLLLTTQTTGDFTTQDKAILAQAATHLYFRPSAYDLKKQANEIERSKHEKWMNLLEKLKIGECIAVGNLEINGREIRRPLKLI